MTFLEQIDAYLERTGMTPTVFSVHAMSNPMFVSRLREGVKPRENTIQKVLAFMDDHPDGIIKEEDKEVIRIKRRRRKAHVVYRSANSHFNVVKISQTIDESKLQYVFRDPCEFCETRRDIGCHHYPLQRRA